MPYEIDYIPVDSGDKSGDAIVLRFGNLNDPREQTVIVIDGGFQESGELLVEHIKNHYKTSYVDIVISTHPDNDHISGLKVILEKLTVGQLVMHKPWEHVEDIKSFFKTRTLTKSGLKDKIEKSLQIASDLEALADSKGIKVVEPFEGVGGLDGKIHILGPNKEYYQQLLANFRSTPEAIPALAAFAPIQRMAQAAIKTVQDFWHIDLLDDDDDTTSAENNTSTIILFNLDGHKLLFTGDAGKTALFNAINYASSLGIALADLQFLDVPHHGSKRNINSKILKGIKAGTAFVSASKDSLKHPSKKVTNGLQKHGASVFVTRGAGILHHNGGNARSWGNATAEPFHSYVED